MFNMKIVVVYFLALFGLAFGLPSPIDEFNFDKLTPNNVYVEPIEGAPKYAGPRIVGGAEVTRNSVPYQVAVIVDGNSLCGGSLISPSAVLTAAHCTYRASFVILYLGAHDISQAESSRVTVISTNIHNEPDYDESNIRNDIAIVVLPSPVILTNAIQVIGLAPEYGGTYAGHPAFLSGWGVTTDTSSSISPVLRGVNLNIITNSLCQAYFGTFIIASNICTSGAGTVGTCDSDSGGPLVVDGGTQVGVVSYGSASCESGAPSVYARISSYRFWIYSIAGV